MVCDEKFPLDGHPKAVQINIVSDYGMKWINIMNTNWFSLNSSAWLGRTSRRKQGLKRQAEKIMRAAQQNPVNGTAPRVIFRFPKVVSREVAEALIAMGAEVEGTVVNAR